MRSVQVLEQERMLVAEEERNFECFDMAVTEVGRGVEGIGNQVVGGRDRCNC